VWNYTFFIDRQQQVSKTGCRKLGLKNSNDPIFQPFSPHISPVDADIAQQICFHKGFPD
jgi:hypothetical protein